MIKKNEIKKNLNENYSNIGKIKTVKLLNQDNNSINFIVKTSKDNYVWKKFLDFVYIIPKLHLNQKVLLFDKIFYKEF